VYNEKTPKQKKNPPEKLRVYRRVGASGVRRSLSDQNAKVGYSQPYGRLEEPGGG